MISRRGLDIAVLLQQRSLIRSPRPIRTKRTPRRGVQSHRVRIRRLRGPLRRSCIVLRALTSGIAETFYDIDLPASGPLALAEHPEGRPGAEAEGDVVDVDDGEHGGVVLFLGGKADGGAHGLDGGGEVDGHIRGPVGGAAGGRLVL